MKKINLLILGIVAMFGFAFTAKAVDTGEYAYMDCENQEIKIGESTVCTVTIGHNTPLKSVVVTLDPSVHLEISSVTAGTAAGWSEDLVNTVKANHVYAFTNNSTEGLTARTQVFSFTVKLLESAKQLSANDECGNLCFKSITANNGAVNFTSLKKENKGNCYEPIIIDEECTENCDPKNPETGAFMNYLIIVGVGIAAIAVILIVRKTTKFYRV